MVIFHLLHYLCDVLLTYVSRKPWFWSAWRKLDNGGM